MFVVMLCSTFCFAFAPASNAIWFFAQPVASYDENSNGFYSEQTGDKDAADRWRQEQEPGFDKAKSDYSKEQVEYTPPAPENL